MTGFGREGGLSIFENLLGILFLPGEKGARDKDKDGEACEEYQGEGDRPALQ